MQDRLSNWTLTDFEKYNDRFDAGAFRGSEAPKYDLNAIKRWISIRDNLTFTDKEEDIESGDWKYLLIVDRLTKTKYGTNYIFIDADRKLWRIKCTANEFYNGPENPLD